MAPTSLLSLSTTGTTYWFDVISINASIRGVPRLAVLTERSTRSPICLSRTP